MDLTLDRWLGASAGEQEALARRLASELPTGFAFESIRRPRPGMPGHPVAFFRQGAARFALIPGCQATLGHDLDRGWEPDPDELESWEQTQEEYGFDETLEERIGEATLRPRQVELAPFLIEALATDDVLWESLPIDDPEVVEILRNYPKGDVEYHGKNTTEVRRGEDGLVLVRRARVLTHSEVAAELASSGFRLPTSDEWEYACSGGASTLFHWGDHAPGDRYPTEMTPKEAAWWRQHELSREWPEYPAKGFARAWDRHRRPNGFGLYIASNPYEWELVAEPGKTRGGDGGSIICGGAGFFVAWLVLATSYYADHDCEHDVSEPVMPEYTLCRRLLTLG